LGLNADDSCRPEFAGNIGVHDLNHILCRNGSLSQGRPNLIQTIPAMMLVGVDDSRRIRQGLPMAREQHGHLFLERQFFEARK
jgi:hypothetical protein